MATKKKALKEAFASKAQSTSKPSTVSISDTVDRIQSSYYTTPDVKKALKVMAAENETSGGVNGLLTEAINDLFRKHGKPPIA